ncbi:tubulin alpha chain-like [Hibiscus syriacus]|uniref:tubulin alpha chain-like n=1 Tax=Hibiscus syriacus TaxID=106335 RepID=UPI0019246ACB|nr:tubulin alpha chain-like [Hibiscus syriacus]
MVKLLESRPEQVPKDRQDLQGQATSSVGPTVAVPILPGGSSRLCLYNCTGFLIFNAIGGGTGSCLGFFVILERLSVDYGKKSKLVFGSVSIQFLKSLILLLSPTIVFSQLTLLEHTDETFSSLTASLRLDGALNVDVTDFQTNLVPYKLSDSNLEFIKNEIIGNSKGRDTRMPTAEDGRSGYGDKRVGTTIVDTEPQSRGWISESLTHCG